MKRSDFLTFLDNIDKAKALEDELFLVVQEYVRKGLPQDLVLEPVETLLDRVMLELNDGTTKDLKSLYTTHLTAIDMIYGTEVENHDRFPDD